MNYFNFIKKSLIKIINYADVINGFLTNRLAVDIMLKYIHVVIVVKGRSDDYYISFDQRVVRKTLELY